MATDYGKLTDELCLSTSQAKPEHPHGTPPGQNPDFVPPGQGGTPPGEAKPKPDQGLPEPPEAEPKSAQARGRH